MILVRREVWCGIALMTLLAQACERRDGKMTEHFTSTVEQRIKMKGGNML
jgi:hypothetical protein